MRWALAASQAQPQTQQNCPQTARYLRPCPGPGVLQRPESSLDLALSSAEQLLGEIVSAFPYSKNWGEKEEENRTWTHKPQSVEVPAGPGWYMPGGGPLSWASWRAGHTTAGGQRWCGLCAGLGLLQVRWRVMARRA